MQELFVGSAVKDTVIRWLGEVDGELVLGGSSLGGSGGDFGLQRQEKERGWV